MKRAVDGIVKIEGERGLYVRCTGTGSPTVIMEGGDFEDLIEAADIPSPYVLVGTSGGRPSDRVHAVRPSERLSDSTVLRLAGLRRGLRAG